MSNFKEYILLNRLGVKLNPDEAIVFIVKKKSMFNTNQYDKYSNEKINIDKSRKWFHNYIDNHILNNKFENDINDNVEEIIYKSKL